MTDNDANSQPAQQPQSYLDVADCNDYMLIRVCGLANMHLALSLHDFILDSLSRDYHHVLLDMSSCRGLDSTFMGTLINLSAETRKEEMDIQLYNVTEQCWRLLEMLGADRFLSCGGAHEFPDLDFARIEPELADPRRRIEVIRRAHEHLFDIDESNRKRFGRFLELLSEEMNGCANGNGTGQNS
jgi:anti-sigma B factor antagonist